MVLKKPPPQKNISIIHLLKVTETKAYIFIYITVVLFNIKFLNKGVRRSGTKKRNRKEESKKKEIINLQSSDEKSEKSRYSCEKYLNFKIF